MGVKTKLSSAAFAAVLTFAIPMIKHSEGVMYDPYYDVAGVLTVCNGITGPDVIPGKRYTQSECDALLVKHIKIASDYIDRVVRVEMPPSMRAAMISFVFNVGRGAFGSSTMLKDINAGKLRSACNRLYDWVYITDPKTKKKVKSKGLFNRRDYEHGYCVKELDK